MQESKRYIAIAAMVTGALIQCGYACAEEGENNTVRVGYAKVRFNVQSSDLMGPPGTTPPGLKIDVKDLDIFALSYERRLSDVWAVQFQGGIPPRLTAVGAGGAAPVGTVATTRIWFPTLLVRYSLPSIGAITPYIGIGMTYTFFTQQSVSAGYTAALQGNSSTVDLKSDWGPYARLGFEYPINKNWCLNLEYSGFRLATTATVATQTPGAGLIARHVDIKDTPQIFGLTLGYKF